MGKTCLRAVIDRPDMDLVGLYVYRDSKVGTDAGEIAHRDATGVLASNDIEEILALDADVVLHTAQIQSPYSAHNRDICRLLASGKNVISINGHTYPRYWGTGYQQEFLDACTAGGSTLFGTGLNPGFIAEKIATIATGICLELEHIDVTERVDCTVMQNPTYVFDMLGFGQDCGDVDPNDPDWAPGQIMGGMFSEVVAHLVERLGFLLERVEADHVMYPATTDIQMSAGLIRKGGISHTHWRWHGIARGRRVVTQNIHWLMETAHLNEQDYRLWTVAIRGLPEIDITIDLKTPENHAFRTTPEQYGVAGAVINAIPAVVSAPPGIREYPVADTFHVR
jgi:hypothetical protein